MLYHRDFSKTGAPFKVTRYLALNWDVSQDGEVVCAWCFNLTKYEAL